MLNDIKLSLHRHGQALGAPGVWGSPISSQTAHECGKVFRHMQWLPLPPQEIFLVLISVRGQFGPRAIVGPKDLVDKKSKWPHLDWILMFQIMVQCPKQLHHCVPPVIYIALPNSNMTATKTVYIIKFYTGNTYVSPLLVSSYNVFLLLNSVHNEFPSHFHLQISTFSILSFIL
jgi:hypothetical protein